LCEVSKNPKVVRVKERPEQMDPIYDLIVVGIVGLLVAFNIYG